jgi:hypothetical protein
MFQRFSDWIGLSLGDVDIQYRIHATQRMFSRNIAEKEILHILANGLIIENYENDFPFPSLLVSGNTENNRPLHAVVAIDRRLNRLYVITTYEPNPHKWNVDFTQRISA